MEAPDDGGDFTRMVSPALGGGGQRQHLLLQQPTFESVASSELDFEVHRLGSDVSEEASSEARSQQHRRAAAGPERRRQSDALFKQSIEYTNGTRRSWAGSATPEPTGGLTRMTSETVQLTPHASTPVRQSAETGITITPTLGRDDRRMAMLGANTEEDKPTQLTYLHGSYRINSYFAIRLLRIMQIIVAVDIVALVFFYAYKRGRDNKHGGSLYVSSPLKGIFKRGDSCSVTISLAAMMYHLLPAAIILGLPASGLRVFEPFKREDRIGRGGRIQKVKRTIFLQICEMTAVLVFLMTGMVAVIAAYHLVVGELFNCNENPSVYLFGGLGFGVYLLMYVEIRYFTRFREHLKMQLGAFSEADQTGDVKAHMHRSKMKRRRMQEQIAQANMPVKGPGGTIGAPAPPTQPPPRKQIVEFVRKRLYRGAQLGDIRLLKRTLRIAKNHLGANFAKELYPDAQIMFGYFSKSTKNPMHVAAYHGSIPAMELLYHASFSINSFDKISRVRFSTGDIFWYLARSIIRQPVINAEDAYGAASVFNSTLVTPLHCAVSTGRADAVRWLLRHGADVNLCSKSSCRHESRLPPIFLADHPEIAKELLAAGANHLVIPDPGHMNTITVLQMAYLRGNYAVAQVLENWGGDVALTPLHTAAAMNNTARMRQLLRKKVNPDCLGELGYVGLNKRTPLHWACVIGAIDAVELLLGASANPNIQDTRGRTPLHWAARVNQVEAVKVLLDHGADPNVVDDGGMTPIQCAACAGGTTAEMFKVLVNHGANINHQLPSTGDTALHIAVKLDDLPTAVALLSVGGDIMRMNHDGLRPIDCTTSTRLQFEIKRAAGNRDVMISYTHSHKEFALKLRKSLEDANITTWLDLMDPSGIGGGAVWREEIARGVTNAAVVVCILTEDYAQSQWCMKELALAKQVGTPILAISTENAKISEELQVYLYTRQIIPFESAITSVDHESERDIRYEYDDEIYRQQLRLLVDGLRDEIEKRKEHILRKNLSRAATMSSMNTGGSTGDTFNSNGTGIGISRNRSRGRWNQGSSNTIGSAAPFSNATVAFDERGQAQMLQEQMMLESTSRDGFLFSSNHQTGPRGRNNLALQAASNRWQRGNAFYETNASIISNSNSFIEGINGQSFGGLGVNDLTSSIILNQNGYYVHQPGFDGSPTQRGVAPSIGSGSVIETFEEAKEVVDGGEQFVFISHGDWHITFVRRLCEALCREGGLHCYVDRRHKLGRGDSKIDEHDTTPTSPESVAQSSGDGNLANDDDMLRRIHDAKEAILKCSAFVVIVSDKTLRSQLVKDQLAFAEDKGKKIIPVVANPLEFSLDMQYSLSRSEFFHFFSSGDMIGFEKALDRVLSALREEIYGISVETPAMSTFRLPKTLSLGQLSSFSGHTGAESVASLRRRPGSNRSIGGGDAASVTSSGRGWLDLGSRSMSHSFLGSSTSSHPPAPRSLNSDMSLHQSMLGNFSTLMRGVMDEEDDEYEDHPLEDELLGEDDDLDPLFDNNMHAFDEEYTQTDRGTFSSGMSPTDLQSGYQTRPGRLSSIMSNSATSVSILEHPSDEPTTPTIDGVEMGDGRNAVQTTDYHCTGTIPIELTDTVTRI